MPLLSTFGSSSSKSYGTTGIITGGSALFNAVGARFAITSPNPATQFAYGTGNFTIEMWFYPTSFSDYRILWRQSSVVYLFTNINTGQLIFYYGTATYPFGGLPTLNAWNHVAVVRNGNSIRIFLNGVGFTPVAITTNFINPDLFPVIGQWVSNNTLYRFIGYITNVKITRQALYTTDFEPSRVPFTRTSQGSSSANVALLLNMKNSATLSTDSSASPVTIDNNSVTFNTLSPYAGAYTPFAPVIVVSAIVTPDTTTPSEGDTVTFTVVGTNTTNGTYFYTVEEDLGVGALTAADFTSGSLSGSFTITSNSGSFTLTLSKDLTTEGTESFRVFVRQTSTTGPILGSTGEITVTDVSLTPAFTVAPGSIDEGSSGTFTVQNVGPDGTYYWTILPVAPLPAQAADFTAMNGSFTVSGATGGIDNGSGSFSVGIIADRTTEASETFRVQVRSGSISGTVIVTSDPVIISDTSKTPAFTSTPTSINEGVSEIYTVNNLGPAGTYYWTILHGTTVDADFSAVNGTITTSSLNGTGGINILAVLDYTTEGSQTFQIQVREGSITGNVLVTSSVITINDSSTTVTASASSVLVIENSSVTITASATAFPNGTYYWTILNGSTTNADFSAASGSFTVSNGTSGTFAVTVVGGDGADAGETFQVEIRSASTSGPVLATTGIITIISNA